VSKLPTVEDELKILLENATKNIRILIAQRDEAWAKLNQAELGFQECYKDLVKARAEIHKLKMQAHQANA